MDITRILEAMQRGEPQAPDQLLAEVYQELRKLAAHKMAAEAPGHTLQATALVHEAWLRLGGGVGLHFQNRAHFFAAVGEAMRRSWWKTLAGRAGSNEAEISKGWTLR